MTKTAIQKTDDKCFKIQKKAEANHPGCPICGNKIGLSDHEKWILCVSDKCYWGKKNGE